MFTIYTTNKRTGERTEFATVKTEAQALRICESWGWSMSDTNGDYWLNFEIDPWRKVELYGVLLDYMAELVDSMELPHVLHLIGFTDEEIAHELQ